MEAYSPLTQGRRLNDRTLVQVLFFASSYFSLMTYWCEKKRKHRVKALEDEKLCSYPL